MGNMIINLPDIDISQSKEFAEYADFKEHLQFEMDNRPFSHTYLPPEIKARDEALSNSLRKMDATNLKQKADALIKAQQLDNRYQELINHMAAKQTDSYNQFNAMWSPVLWQSLEDRSQAKVSVGNQTMEAFDLDYAIAESLGLSVRNKLRLTSTLTAPPKKKSPPAILLLPSWTTAKPKSNASSPFTAAPLLTRTAGSRLKPSKS